MKKMLTKNEIIALEKLGIQIKKIRIKNNMTQKDLSKLIGISIQSISAIECGKQMPSYGTLILFVKAFNMTMSDFFKDFEV